MVVGVAADLSAIIPGRLWQSGTLEAEGAMEAIRDAGITYVVNLCGDGPVLSPPDPLRPFTEVRWEIDDGPLPDLDQLDAVVSRVCAAIQQGERVLVHCYAGLNRSGLVNALVVRRLKGVSGAELVAYIRRRRPGALSNRRFVQHILSLR